MLFYIVAISVHLVVAVVSISSLFTTSTLIWENGTETSWRRSRKVFPERSDNTRKDGFVYIAKIWRVVGGVRGLEMNASLDSIMTATQSMIWPLCSQQQGGERRHGFWTQEDGCQSPRKSISIFVASGKCEQCLHGRRSQLQTKDIIITRHEFLNSWYFESSYETWCSRIWYWIEQFHKWSECWNND